MTLNEWKMDCLSVRQVFVAESDKCRNVFTITLRHEGVKAEIDLKRVKDLIFRSQLFPAT